MKRKILELLKEDARLTAEQIGVMLNITREEAQAHIRALEEEHLILKYAAMVNEDKIDDSSVRALIEVKVSPQQNMGFDAIAEKLYNIPEVKSVYLMSGAYDLMVIIEGRSLRDVAMFVSQRLSTIDNVLSTATHFILKQYKKDGVILTEGTADGRMVVSP